MEYFLPQIVESNVLKKRSLIFRRFLFCTLSRWSFSNVEVAGGCCGILPWINIGTYQLPKRLSGLLSLDQRIIAVLALMSRYFVP